MQKHDNNIDILDENNIIQELNEKNEKLEIDNKKLLDQKMEIKKHTEEVLVKFKNDLNDTEYLIDKRIVSSFVIKVLDKSNKKKIRLTVLDTLANFLGYNNEERKIIGLGPNSSQNVNSYNPSSTEKIKEISNDLYNFILNA